MSLSDCPKCWDTPCTCGHEYQDWTVERLEAQIQMLKAIQFKKLFPPLPVLETALEEHVQKELVHAPRYGKGIYPIPPMTLLNVLPAEGHADRSVLVLGDAQKATWRVEVTGSPEGYRPRIGTVVAHK